MKLSLGSFYSEVGVFFKISYKVDLFIRETLIEKIFKPYGLDIINPGWTIDLNVTTSKNTLSTRATGPEIDKRNKFYNFGLWLPYYEIVRSKNYLNTYIDNYFVALEYVFHDYKIEIKDILLVKEIVKNEILNNPEYAYEAP